MELPVELPVPPIVAPPRFGGVLAALGVGVLLSSLGLGLYVRGLKVRRDTVQTLAPGLSLTREIVHTPTEDVPILTLRADVGQNWKLRLVPAAEQVLPHRAVSQIAAEYNAKNADRAPVAVNGGFFAYDGAAVGAVKIDGEWQRLPWKNRTAIGWDDGARPSIDNLSARAFIRTANGDISVANLNGRPGNRNCALLTWRFGSSYKLQKDESAVIISDGKVTGALSAGSVSLHRPLQVLVAGAQSAQKALVDGLKVGEAAKFVVEATPSKWNSTANILGAGPRLIADGAIKNSQVAEEFRPDVLARGPRTMIGLDTKGNLIVMVIEAWFKPPGATRALRGMTLDAAAAEMQRAGAVEAINLDGGSSTTMWVRGKTVTAASDYVQGNKIIEPASDRREVGVTNAVLIEQGTQNSSENSSQNGPAN